MGDDEQQDVVIGAPAADAGDAPEPDPLGPDVPPDDEDEKGE